MLASVLAASSDFVRPDFDWHALAPEIVLVVTIALCLLVDVFTTEQSRWTASSIAGIGMLAALVPIFTLAYDDTTRVLFGGAIVVDDFALVLSGLFLVAGYFTILLSTNYIAEGDYAEGEYYLMLLSAVFGMVVMASARDLISIFIALEMLSIPAYLMAGWRKRTLTGNEAGMKYYLMGVFASAVMLYGMSLIFGGTGSTVLAQIGDQVNANFMDEPIAVLGIIFVLIGFAGQADIIRPFMFIIATLTMTVGNVIALRQTNVVRLFAYSSVAQAGFILAPLSVFGISARSSHDVLIAVVTYVIIYTVVNLGAFAVIIAVSRRTGTGEIASWGGLWTYAPQLAIAMGAFLFALAGIPIAAGWFAKFQAFTAVVSGNSGLGYVMGVVMAVNSVIALGYYLSLMRVMFMDDVPDGDVTPIRVPVTIGVVVGAALLFTIAVGIFPSLVSDLAEGATLAFAPGS